MLAVSLAGCCWMKCVSVGLLHSSTNKQKKNKSLVFYTTIIRLLYILSYFTLLHFTTLSISFCFMKKKKIFFSLNFLLVFDTALPSSALAALAAAAGDDSGHNSNDVVYDIGFSMICFVFIHKQKKS